MQHLFDQYIDTDCIFKRITCDPDFDGLLKVMTPRVAMSAIAEAFNFMHKPEVEESFSLTLGGCMVVSLIQQVLVRFLIQKLMNLMTAEAVILHHNMIPYSYLRNYLVKQAHFSLKRVITNYHKGIKATLR